ncbi:hypothetical protein SESBI_40376, partial [Sesbania bispinosa]
MPLGCGTVTKRATVNGGAVRMGENAAAMDEEDRGTRGGSIAVGVRCALASGACGCAVTATVMGGFDGDGWCSDGNYLWKSWSSACTEDIDDLEKYDNPDLQKQIGCTTGIFKLFDRHHIIIARRISRKRLLPDNQSSREYKHTKQAE